MAKEEVLTFLQDILDAIAIVDTRNRIIHAYDNVQPEFLWGLVIRHIPELKKDVQRILSEYEKQYNHENSITPAC